jgi:hypothetical protein
MKKTIMILLATMVSMASFAEHWPTGYYRMVTDPNNSFYYNDEYRWYCHVQNATQGALFDVDAQVHIIGDVYSFLGNATSIGECPWPNGFYTTGGETPVTYRLYPGNICQVTSVEMLAAYGGVDQVIPAEENSDFGAHRTFIGQCFWPTYD